MKPHPNKALENRFVLSMIFTAAILIAEVIGGLWTGSLALLSDAAHVFMDVFALALSFLALRLSALPADDRHTYGYHRLEVLAALVNGVTLGAIAIEILRKPGRAGKPPPPSKASKCWSSPLSGWRSTSWSPLSSEDMLTRMSTKKVKKSMKKPKT